jgi:predicted metal-binding membrane protein
VRVLGPRHHGAWFVPIIGCLIGVAWLTLAVWSHSPYGRYLDHGRWSDIGPVAPICSAVPYGSVLIPALLYAGGWALMISAMMLPTTLPLLDRFNRLVAARPDRRELTALLIAGYLSAWVGFGIAAHLLDALVHQVAARLPWLIQHGWILGTLVLGVAGGFQFTTFKYRCLDRCRAPLGFIIAHWHGMAPYTEAFRLGLAHGLFCVGCCWAIMLLMFIVGTGNVGWMLALGVVMALEKNVPWGQRISRPLGGALLGWAALTSLMNLMA